MRKDSATWSLFSRVIFRRAALGSPRALVAMSESADALLKKADKKMGTTLMRWRPDYESASMLYEEAGAWGHDVNKCVFPFFCCGTNKRETTRRHLDLVAFLARRRQNAAAERVAQAHAAVTRVRAMERSARRGGASTDVFPPPRDSSALPRPLRTPTHWALSFRHLYF